MNKGYLIQTGSILFNSISLLLNKFVLMDIDFMNVVLANMVFSLLICLFFYKDIKITFNLLLLKLYLPISLINMLGIIGLYYSMCSLSPSIFGLLNRFYILFALIMGWIIFREKLSYGQLLLVGISVIGGIIFMFKNKNFIFNILSVVMCLFSSFCFALSYALIRLKKVKVAPKIAFFYNNLFGIFPIIIYFIYKNKELVYPNYLQIIYLLGASICFLVSMIYFFKGLEYLSFNEANILRSFSPVVLTIISLPFFPEQLSLINIIGGLIVIISLTLIGVLKHDYKCRTKN